jgi:hypothetical protein
MKMSKARDAKQARRKMKNGFNKNEYKEWIRLSIGTRCDEALQEIAPE